MPFRVLVCLRVKVTIVIKKVSVMRTIAVPPSPRIMFFPVTREIISTDGTVKQMVATAEPMHRLIERCNLLLYAALTELIPSGARTSRAIIKPPKVVGRPASEILYSNPRERFFESRIIINSPRIRSVT